MKEFGKKVLAILGDIEAWLTFALILVVGLFHGLIPGLLAGIAGYILINVLQPVRKRANLFGITPPGDDPPNRPPPEGEQ